MKLVFVMILWLAMGGVLSFGLVKAVNGHPWLLIASVVVFFVAMGRACVASH